MVWYDTAHKVRIRVFQCGHELEQLLFVELADRSEHAFLGALAERRVVSALRNCHADNLSFYTREIKKHKTLNTLKKPSENSIF